MAMIYHRENNPEIFSEDNFQNDSFVILNKSSNSLYETKRKLDNNGDSLTKNNKNQIIQGKYIFENYHLPEEVQSEELRRKQFMIPSIYESVNSPSSQNYYNDQRLFKRDDNIRTTFNTLSNYLKKCKKNSSQRETSLLFENFKGQIKRSATFVNTSSSYNVRQKYNCHLRKRKEIECNNERFQSPSKHYIRRCDSVFLTSPVIHIPEEEKNSFDNFDKKKIIYNNASQRYLFFPSRRKYNIKNKSNLNKTLSSSVRSLSESSVALTPSCKSISITSLNLHSLDSSFSEISNKEPLKDDSRNKGKIISFMRGITSFLRNSKKKFKVNEVRLRNFIWCI